MPPQIDLLEQVCLDRDDDPDDDEGGYRPGGLLRDAGHEAAPGLVRALELEGTSQPALAGGRAMTPAGRSDGGAARGACMTEL